MRWVILTGLVGCIPTQPTVPSVDSSDASGCQEQTTACACEHLASLGCQEQSPNCTTVLQHILDERVTVIDLRCIVTAQTQEQVRGCPAILCP